MLSNKAALAAIGAVALVGASATGCFSRRDKPTRPQWRRIERLS
jgi:hypothetical protein